MKRFLLSLFLASGALAADPGVLKSEFIFDTAPFPSCHASTIAQVPDGLVASWFGGTAERNPDVGIWVSRSMNGNAWSPPVEVANGVQADGQRFPCWNPVLFEVPQLVRHHHELVLFYKVGPSPSKWWGMLRTSHDDGVTWNEAKRLPDGILGPIKNKPVLLSDGRTLLCPSSTETEKPSAWRLHFERTLLFHDLEAPEPADNFSWTTSAPSSAGDPPVDAIQPSILELGGGKLMAIGRSKQKHLFQVTSDDLGKTWGTMSLLDLPNPNSGTDAVTLKDGRHLLIYNHTASGRSPLNLAASTDGIHWQAAAVLENEPRAEFSYPAIIQTADGLVHITHTWKRKKIKHWVIDPAKLELKPFSQP